jgi:hypothetical protein
MVRHDEIAVLANGVTPEVIMELYEVAIMRGYGFTGDGAWGYFHVMKHSMKAPAHALGRLQEHTQCFWAPNYPGARTASCVQALIARSRGLILEEICLGQSLPSLDGVSDVVLGGTAAYFTATETKPNVVIYNRHC